MLKPAIVFLSALMFLVGCKGRTEKTVDSAAAESATSPASATSTLPSTIPSESVDPPAADVGISVEQAYAAIPHRRTVWVEDNSSVPADERAYLKVIFQVMDQAVAVRVAGQQNYGNQRFDNPDIDGHFDQLISYARGMSVPPALATYHQDILDALTAQRKVFVDWKTGRERFPYAQHLDNDPDARKASSFLQAAYGVLMSKYPSEPSTNKDAFYDYHCALDFM